ncbi:STAS domain-containing protein [Paramagnetospirillum magneticum]|uniref:STAS domain-containing protein n=1 Tax=Paramagnetospirillum magneticum (strain ATCC 700264 / AMB-1) TaxID=342108 RepID=Q2W1D8_PARM1|nr:STAS domain-containing protein [Paramagnetospirillum magneticum]BAE52337.1 hypothetical protein amb3533 [Paramagnetospirillum magneticum AMB-1]
MACEVVHEDAKTVFRLVGQLDDLDFDRIEVGFETVIEQPDAVVIFDFAELETLSASLLALLGMLRLHACRVGAQLELRHLNPSVRTFLDSRQH